MGFAGWGNSTLVDRRGRAILEEWLASDPKQRFLPDIPASDTLPNYDGGFLFGFRETGDASRPIGRINVQLKGTELDLKNNNSNKNQSDFKFSCDAAVFHAVRKQVSFDPTLLIIVQVVERAIFAIDLSPSYIASLNLSDNQGTKTVYFDESNRLADYDSFFLWLTKRRDETARRFNQVLYSQLISSSDIPTAVLPKLQAAHQYMVRLLNSSYSFLYNSFPSAWTIALAYANKDGRTYLGIVPILYGESEMQPIRLMQLAEANCSGNGWPLTDRFETDPVFTCISESDDYTDMVNLILKHWTKAFLNTQLIPPSLMSATMLAEEIYWFLDKLARAYPALSIEQSSSFFKEDELTPSQCERIIPACYLAAEYSLVHPMIVPVNNSSLHLFDLFDAHSPLRHSKEAIERLHDLIFDDAPLPTRELNIHFTEDHAPMQHIESAIQEAISRGLSIKRPWSHSGTQALQNRFNSLLEDREALSSNYSIKKFDSACDRNCYVENVLHLKQVIETELPKLVSEFFGYSDVVKQLARHFSITLELSDNYVRMKLETRESTSLSISICERNLFEVQKSSAAICNSISSNTILNSYLPQFSYNRPYFIIATMVLERIIRDIISDSASYPIDNNSICSKRSGLQNSRTMIHLPRRI